MPWPRNMRGTLLYIFLFAILCPPLALAQPALIKAIDAGDVALFQQVTKQQSPDMTYRDVYGRSYLHKAIEAGNIAIAEQLIALGADIHAKDMRGMTPLHLMAWNAHPDMTRMLVAHRASLEARDVLGRTPFLLAAFVNNYPIAEILLEAGARAEVWDDNGNNAFHGEALSGVMFYTYRPQMLELLSQQGLDANARNLFGHTPLMVAAMSGLEERVEILLSLGADASLKDAQGNRAHDYAVQAGDDRLAKRLR